ncbi:MAG: hypothetical protein ACE5EM_00270 [Sphingomonadales bacterium]
MCVALSASGEAAEAFATCDRAIELFPGRWQAFVNRGTARLVTNQLEDAIRDYHSALELEPNSGAITDLIRRNLELAEARLAR